MMCRMHKPDSKLGPYEQDKHSVIAINQADWDTWLSGPHEGTQALRSGSSRSKTPTPGQTMRPDQPASFQSNIPPNAPRAITIGIVFRGGGTGRRGRGESVHQPSRAR